jgi:outer membrane protein assembly factor BamB
MKTSDLIFVGIKGTVLALNRATGNQVWATHLKGYEFVNVAFDCGKVLATCCGEAFCLDPLTGNAVWHNPLKGLGRGLATIASETMTSALPPVQAEKLQRDAAAAAAAAAVA